MDEAKYEISVYGDVQGFIVGENNSIGFKNQGDRLSLDQHSQEISLPIWNVPYLRNPLFAGRENLLNQLHNSLKSTKAAALTQPQAISGLGGIGKTQIAIEYAYRYRSEYPIILWVRADTRDTLIADYAIISDLLHLAIKDEEDQMFTVAAVKRWLANQTNWLLIMDNADNLDLAYDFIPSGIDTDGYILLTTRAYATGGIANGVQVERMDVDEGSLLLLRRSRALGSEDQLDQAKEADRIRSEAIINVLDGLPLAIDQAGAYIEETGCSLTDYLEFYETQRSLMLKERGSIVFGHPESVTTTFSLIFQKVQEAKQSAADVLRLCAFLHPDEIPEEIIVEVDSAPKFDPTFEPIVADRFELNNAIKLLLRYSLVRRDSDSRTLTVHRLVQAVLKDEMDESLRRQWAERAVRSVSRSFPFAKPTTWRKCQRLLPHAYACAVLIEQWEIERIEAAGLLYRMGLYFYDRAIYSDAEPYYQQALSTCERVKGRDDPDIASILTGLGQLYEHQGKYAQAVIIQQQALEIRRKVFGQEDLHVADSFYNLANVYSDQGKFTKAESLYLQALEIRRKILGPRHPEVGAVLNNLGLFYVTQEKYAEAEPLLQQSLEIKELGADDINLSSNLSNLASLYRVQGRYTEAEKLSRRALAICEELEGPEHPDVATRSNNLALVYYDQGKLVEAEALYLRSLEIGEKALGQNHPKVATALANLGSLYMAQEKFNQAEPLLKRALTIRESLLGPVHPQVATNLNNLALCCFRQGKFDQAEPLYRQALTTWQQISSPTYSNLIVVLEDYAALLRAMNRDSDAKELETKANAIKARNLVEKRLSNREDRKPKPSSKRPYKMNNRRERR